MESSRILKMSISNAVINVLKIDTRNILDHIVKAYLRTVRLLICCWSLSLEILVINSRKSFSSIVQIKFKRVQINFKCKAQRFD